MGGGLSRLRRSRSARLDRWIFALLLATSAGCASSPWTVIRRSGPPSMLREASSVAVLVDASSVVVDGRSFTDLAADDRASLERALVTLGEGVRTQLSLGLSVPVTPATDTLPSDTVLLVIRVLSIDRTESIHRNPREMFVQLDWVRDGILTDSIQVAAWPYRGRGSRWRFGSLYDFERRIELMAEELGRAATEFFRQVSS